MCPHPILWPGVPEPKTHSLSASESVALCANREKPSAGSTNVSVSFSFSTATANPDGFAIHLRFSLESLGEPLVAVTTPGTGALPWCGSLKMSPSAMASARITASVWASTVVGAIGGDGGSGAGGGAGGAGGPGGAGVGGLGGDGGGGAGPGGRAGHGGAPDGVALTIVEIATSSR